MTTIPLVIRPAVDSDFISLLQVFNASRKSAKCFGGGDASLDALSGMTRGEEIYVAEMGQNAAGFVSVWLTDKFIHHLYIAPEYQRRGIGRKLLLFCEKQYGLPLSLKCETANLRARRFYDRQGWTPGEAGIGPDGPWQRLWWYPPPADDESND